MIGTRRCVVAVLAAVAAICVAVRPGQAQTSQTVLEVRVEGNQRVSAAAILTHVKTRAGEAYDESVIAADQKRLMETRQFASVTVARTAAEGGVIVMFTVAERPAVAAVEIAGNKQIKTSELRKQLTVGVGDPADRFQIEQSRKALETYYREKGYSESQVAVDVQALEEGKVVFTVTEGVRTIVRRIRFEGNTHFGRLKLLTTIGSSARFWPFVTGALNEEQVAKDVDVLRNLYVDEGYLDAKVSSRVDYSKNRKKAVLAFVIEEGPRYRVNEVVFNGNMVFSGQELAGRLILGKGQFFTTLSLQRDVKRVQDAYGEIGYIEATVQAARRFPAPTGEQAEAVVNVVFDITESDQYRVGKINVRGNSATQDRVIRRDLRFFPEQLFNTVAVEESRKRLMETRLFRQVTILPEGTAPGVRNAVVTVEEGQHAPRFALLGV